MSGFIPALNSSCVIAPSRSNSSQREATASAPQTSQFSHFDAFVKTRQAEPLFEGKHKKRQGFFEQMTQASFGPQIKAGQRKIRRQKEDAVESAVQDTTRTVTTQVQNHFLPQIQTLQAANTQLATERDEQFGLGVESVHNQVRALTPNSHLRLANEQYWEAFNKHQRKQLELLQGERKEERAKAPALTFDRLAEDPSSFVGGPADYAYPTPLIPAIMTAPQPVYPQQNPGFGVDGLIPGFRRLMAGSHHSDEGSAPFQIEELGNEDIQSGYGDGESLPSTHHSKSRRSSHVQSDDSGDDSPGPTRSHRGHRRSSHGSRSVASSHHSQRMPKVIEGVPSTYPVRGYTDGGETIRQRKGSILWHLFDKRGDYQGDVTRYRDVKGREHRNKARIKELSGEESDASDSDVSTIREMPKRRWTEGPSRRDAEPEEEWVERPPRRVWTSEW